MQVGEKKKIVQDDNDDNRNTQPKKQNKTKKLGNGNGTKEDNVFFRFEHALYFFAHKIFFFLKDYSCWVNVGVWS